MKFNCSKKDLKEALIAASKALPSKAQTPILNGIYILAENDQLEIQATDFSLGIIIRIPAEIEEEGVMVINGKNITEVISKLAGDIVSVSTEKDVATFKSESASFSLYTMDATDFPKVGVQEFQHSFFIKNDVLRNLITRSTFASSTDDSRPVFQGCAITIAHSTITFVATNTHRLVVVKSEIENDIPDEHTFIVPAKTLNELKWIINSANENNGVKVEFSNKHIAFTINDVFVTCRLIDGQFPPYQKVIPEYCQTYVTCNVGKFLDAISRVDIISKQTAYNTIRFSLGNDEFNISSDSYDTGKVTERIDAKVEGENIDISFNIKYFQDFLKICNNNDEIKIGLNEKFSPVDVRIIDDEDLIYIVTPVRIG